MVVHVFFWFICIGHVMPLSKTERRKKVTFHNLFKIHNSWSFSKRNKVYSIFFYSSSSLSVWYCFCWFFGWLVMYAFIIHGTWYNIIHEFCTAQQNIVKEAYCLRVLDKLWINLIIFKKGVVLTMNKIIFYIHAHRYATVHYYRNDNNVLCLCVKWRKIVVLVGNRKVRTTKHVKIRTEKTLFFSIFWNLSSILIQITLFHRGNM